MHHFPLRTSYARPTPASSMPSFFLHIRAWRFRENAILFACWSPGIFPSSMWFPLLAALACPMHFQAIRDFSGLGMPGNAAMTPNHHRPVGRTCMLLHFSVSHIESFLTLFPCINSVYRMQEHPQIQPCGYRQAKKQHFASFIEFNFSKLRDNYRMEYALKAFARCCRHGILKGNTRSIFPILRGVFVRYRSRICNPHARNRSKQGACPHRYQIPLESPVFPHYLQGKYENLHKKPKKRE